MMPVADASDVSAARERSLEKDLALPFKTQIPAVYVVGNDRKRDKKIEKVSPREVGVSKFDARFLKDSIFARKSSQKDDVGIPSYEDDLQDVFAIEKGASIDWIRERKDRSIVSKIDLGKSVPGGDDTEIMVKQEPGERGSTHVEDDDVQYVGSSVPALRDENTTQKRSGLLGVVLPDEESLTRYCEDAATRSNLKKALNENIAPELLLSRRKDAEVYLASLSPMDVEDFMAWEDDKPTIPQSNEVKEPFVFTTPTKKKPYNSRPMSPVTRERIQMTLPDRHGVMTTRTVSRAVSRSQGNPAPNKQGSSCAEGSSCADDGSQQEWVRPRTMQELFALKRKQMDQKAMWSVNHALKNSRSV